MTFLKRILGILILNAGLLGSRAGIITPGFLPPSATSIVNGYAANNPVNLGLVFTPNSTITVNALGFYDAIGVSAGETVTLYNSVGGPLATASVSDTGSVVDGYFWQSIAPLTLIGGDTYTVSAETGDNPWAFGGPVIVDPRISYVAPVYVYGSSPAFPSSQFFTSPTAYYGPNISIQAVPEPTTILSGALMLLPFGMGAARQLRKKLQAD